MRFKPLGTSRTEVHLLLAYEPEGVYEALGILVGAVRSCVDESLRAFKSFCEHHYHETGAWRGEVVDGQAPRQPVVHAREGWPLADH